MILCQISEISRYYNISPQLAQALKWVSEHYKDEFKAGSQPVGDLGVVVNSQEPAMQSAEASNLEAHRKFIDIHVPLQCVETMGWAPVNTLQNVITPYNVESDFELFGDQAHSLFNVRVGQLAIFFPEDAHAPNIGTGTHRKFCVKVPVD